MRHSGKIKTYSELSKLKTFKARLEYLKLDGVVGRETFGSSRWLNQRFYTSAEWLQFRTKIILRDGGCDLGIPGHDIARFGVIHHINPIELEDILESTDALMDPENSIFVSESTHRVIHYGNLQLAALEFSERRPNDTCPWKEAR